MGDAAGTYSVDGTAITIALGPSTMAACPKDSLGERFAGQLADAAIYCFRSGDLYMDLKYDSGTMRFGPQSSELAGTTWVVIGHNNGRRGCRQLEHPRRDDRRIRCGWHAQELGRLPSVQCRVSNRRQRHLDRSAHRDAAILHGARGNHGARAGIPDCAWHRCQRSNHRRKNGDAQRRRLDCRQLRSGESDPLE